MSDTLVVDTTSSVDKDVSGNKKDEKVSFFKKNCSLIVVVVMVAIVISVNYCKEGFSSSDGVVASSSRSTKQVRSDTEVDRTWNLQELEKSVKLLNRKS